MDSFNYRETNLNLPKKLVVIKKELRETIPNRVKKFTYERLKIRFKVVKKRYYRKLVVKLYKGKPFR